MRHGRDAVALLQGGGHSHRARTGALADTLVEAVGGGLIHQLAAVGGDVGIRRAEFGKPVDRFEKLSDAAPFEWRKHLDRKSTRRLAPYYFGYCCTHID